MRMKLKKKKNFVSFQ